MHHPSLCSPGWKYVCVCVACSHTQQFEQSTDLHMQTIMERACVFFYDGINDLFSLDNAFFNLLGSSIGSAASAAGPKRLSGSFIIKL